MSFFEDPSIFVAFLAGITSVSAPCVLPLLPSYLGYIAGVSFNLENKNRRWKLFFHSLAFGLGFVLIFMLVGTAVGKISEIFLLNKRLFQQIGGILIIFFALLISGLISFRKFQQSRYFRAPLFLEKFKGNFFLGFLRSFLIGILFAFGWSACYGPIIGAILSLVAVQGSSSYGFLLLTVYGIGFTIPFLLAGLFMSSFTSFLEKFKSKLKYWKWGASLLLFLLGLALLTGAFNTFVAQLTVLYEKINLDLL